MGVILLDVDGVCADFTGMVRRLVKGMGGQMPWPVTQWGFIKGSWMDMEPIPGARGVVEAFRRAGHRVVFVTAPWESCVEWAYARTSWLKHEMGADPRDVVITSAKELVRGDVFVDDKIENVAAWREEDYPGRLRGYLWDAPYNRKGAVAKSLPRITGGWTQENIQFLIDKAR